MLHVSFGSLGQNCNFLSSPEIFVYTYVLDYGFVFIKELAPESLSKAENSRARRVAITKEKAYVAAL